MCPQGGLDRRQEYHILKVLSQQHYCFKVKNANRMWSQTVQNQSLLGILYSVTEVKKRELELEI